MTDKALAEFVFALRQKGYVPGPDVWDLSISYVEYECSRHFCVMYVSADAPERIPRTYDLHVNEEVLTQDARNLESIERALSALDIPGCTSPNENAIQEPHGFRGSFDFEQSFGRGLLRNRPTENERAAYARGAQDSASYFVRHTTVRLIDIGAPDLTQHYAILNAVVAEVQAGIKLGTQEGGGDGEVSNPPGRQKPE